MHPQQAAVWFIWRGNALMSSSKGHEYFLKHYLGTHHNDVATPIAKDHVREVAWHEHAPMGKMDLVVDLNFRMDTSALYSDIVLPAATWYEKADLNSTDMHSFIHPLAPAVPPCWESKSDWAIFRSIAQRFSELAAKHFPNPVKDVLSGPLLHDTPAEIAQPSMQDWVDGGVEAVPGRTMPNLQVVTRNYQDLYRQFISLGPLVREKGLGAHGTHYECADFYDQMVATWPVEHWGGKTYPSIKDDLQACNAILHLATVTNGELAWRSFRDMEEKTGLPLVHLAEPTRAVRTDFAAIQARPQRFMNSPMWSGLRTKDAPTHLHVQKETSLVPWRTLTGRQHLYLDHPATPVRRAPADVHRNPCRTEYSDLRVST
ncbi:MAG: molybdopterin-dependent oxidoreductase [Planctomycetes bacterium]|nr:molybdopterin-dependent oxidoreductase [Planctomycetota bacterium]